MPQLISLSLCRPWSRKQNFHLVTNGRNFSRKRGHSNNLGCVVAQIQSSQFCIYAVSLLSHTRLCFCCVVNSLKEDWRPNLRRKPLSTLKLKLSQWLILRLFCTSETISAQMIDEMMTSCSSNEKLEPKLVSQVSLWVFFLALPQNRVDVLRYVFCRRLWTVSPTGQYPSGFSMNFLNGMKV